MNPNCHHLDLLLYQTRQDIILEEYLYIEIGN
jgi:hypothetical protein